MRKTSCFSLNGFTLVELMITIAVLVVLMTLATPSFIDFFDRNRVRGAGDALISLISHARVEAIKNDLDVSVAMTGGGTDWCMGGHAAAPPSGGDPAGVADPCDCTDPGDADACLVSGQRTAIEVGEHPEITVGPLPAAFTFDSTLGAIVPLGARQITLTSPSGKYDLVVEVNTLGQARLCTPADKPSMSGVRTC